MSLGERHREDDDDTVLHHFYTLNNATGYVFSGCAKNFQGGKETSRMASFCTKSSTMKIVTFQTCCDF